VSGLGAVNGDWIQIGSSGNPFLINSYTLTFADDYSRNPNSFKIVGTNDSTFSTWYQVQDCSFNLYYSGANIYSNNLGNTTINYTSLQNITIGPITMTTTGNQTSYYLYTTPINITTYYTYYRIIITSAFGKSNSTPNGFYVALGEWSITTSTGLVINLYNGPVVPIINVNRNSLYKLLQKITNIILFHLKAFV
jgi:hypothetical protein